MATIRKWKTKWQVQIRRKGIRHTSKTFHALGDARVWARHMEVQADRHELPSDPKALARITLGQLVERYRDTVSIGKRTGGTERIVLSAFLTRSICSRLLSELRTEDFASYRDERLKAIKPSSLKRELSPIHNLFEIAKDEWGLCAGAHSGSSSAVATCYGNFFSQDAADAIARQRKCKEFSERLTAGEEKDWQKYDTGETELFYVYVGSDPKMQKDFTLLFFYPGKCHFVGGKNIEDTRVFEFPP
jgi:hypothetical protein